MWWVVVVVKGFRVRDGNKASRIVSPEAVVILVQNANSTFLKNIESNQFANQSVRDQ